MMQCNSVRNAAQNVLYLLMKQIILRSKIKIIMRSIGDFAIKMQKAETKSN